MSKEEKIRQRLKQFAKQFGPMVSLLGKVKSVDEEEMTCVIYDEDTELEYADIRLRPVVEDSDGITLIPKVDAWALAVRIEDDEEWMVLQSSEIDKYKITIGEITFYMDSDGIILNDGDNGGIPILAKILDNLNSLKTYCETMKSAISSGLSAVGAGTAANGASGASTFNASMAGASIDFEDMENNKVKH